MMASGVKIVYVLGLCIKQELCTQVTGFQLEEEQVGMGGKSKRVCKNDLIRR